MNASPAMDQRQEALEKAMKLAATNAEFYLPLKETIVVPELCAAVIALADEVRVLRADKARLDYLDGELAREQKRIAEGLDPGVSLFRMNVPITRERIDTYLP